jgi:hypothetical protein
MSENPDIDVKWWASGLLFENCSCQVVCPGHFSFRNLCTHERCIGHWSIHIDEGKFDTTALGGLNVIVLFNSPQLMFEGGWVEIIYIDERANPAQRNALELILTGKVGGPWAVLNRFVSTQLETQFFPIHFEDEGRRKRMWIEGIFETTVDAIRGRDRDQVVTFENIFNQIHAPSQVIASGSSRHQIDDEALSFTIEGTHGLYSRFSWERK